MFESDCGEFDEAALEIGCKVAEEAMEEAEVAAVELGGICCNAQPLVPAQATPRGPEPPAVVAASRLSTAEEVTEEVKRESKKTVMERIVQLFSECECALDHSIF